MKWFSLPVALSAPLAFAASAPAPASPQLEAVKTVYVMPMSSGLDQYLANAISRLGFLQVVTDPQKADAVLTDHLGASFEDAMKALYPPPTPPKPVKAKTESADSTKSSSGDDSEKQDKAKKKEDPEKAAADKAEADRLNKESEAPVYSQFSRGRGMVFLVDRNSRNVLWSTYDKPKDNQSKTLDHLARQIARHLAADHNPAPPKEKSH